MPSVKKLLRLAEKSPFDELAADYPKAFSTKRGLPLKLKKRSEPGYELKLTRGEVVIEYHDEGELLRALGRWLASPGKPSAEIPAMTLRGLMIDSSRNAVIRPEVLKKILRRLALFGYNAVMLYTEDTYEVKGHPQIGYMRGRYSMADLKALDRYAHKLGIEIIPCIQTLGHLEQMLKLPRYHHLQDDKRILNLRVKEIYDLIGDMLDSASAPFRSKRIHIGLDETWGLSRGKAFRPNTPIDPREDYLKHVGRMMNLCKKRGLEPMMWGDIVIGMSGTDAFSSKQAKRLPKKMQMVFWNYYQPDEDYYRKRIRAYRKMGFEPLVSPGLWSWGRLWSSQAITDISSPVFMRVAREEGVREALMTMWGDDGHETPFGANWPALAQFSEDCWSYSPMRKHSADLVKAVCGTDCSAYSIPGRIDLYPGREEEAVRRFADLGKGILWEDPILGILTVHFKTSKLPAYYRGLAGKVRAAAKKAKVDDRKLFAYAAALADAIELKSDLVNSGRAAYRKKNRKKLAGLVRTVGELIKRMKKLGSAHRDVWLEERRPFGLEVVQNRYGGQVIRLQELKKRLADYVSGKSDRIEEWDEKPQKIYEDAEVRHHSYGRVSTLCLPW